MSTALLPHLVARLLDQTKGPLFFLQKSDGRFVLGWGAKSESTTGPDQHEAIWLGGKCFFSGFTIDPPSLKPAKVNNWHDFPERYFFAPRFFIEGNAKTGEFNFRDEGTTEAEDKAWESFFTETKLRYEKGADSYGETLSITAVVSPHARREWDELCAHIDVLLECGELEKAVPARKKTFVADRKIDTGAVFFRFLQKSGSAAHIFAFRHNKDVFLGASPELLFSSEKDADAYRVQVPAIAGTRARGKDVAADEALGQELLRSAKEQNEHKIVVRFIEEKLAAVGTLKAPTPAPSLLKLPRLQHLYTPLEAQVRNQTRVWTLLDSLHPTPAMGGLPQSAALELLSRFELWERGYYASPMGYSLAGSGECAFVVGIRSCLISDEKVHVFAGAGYVKGSTAEGEWAETQQKIDSVLHVFGKTSHDG